VGLLKTLDPSKITIKKLSAGRLQMELDGDIHDTIAFTQLFPHSRPLSFIAVRKKQGDVYDEVGILKDISSLPLDQQQLIQDDIRYRYFVPNIVKIESFARKRGTDTWVVETDRGRKTFTVKDRTENVILSQRGIVFITDTDKCRYTIAKMQDLDKRSRDLLEIFVM
jgi:hypothetical protein